MALEQILYIENAYIRDYFLLMDSLIKAKKKKNSQENRIKILKVKHIAVLIMRLSYNDFKNKK